MHRVGLRNNPATGQCGSSAEGRRSINDRITTNPELCHGKLVIRGLRYPVQNILEWLASGTSEEEILADYDNLKREDILAALDYTARLSHVKRIEANIKHVA